MSPPKSERAASGKAAPISQEAEDKSTQPTVSTNLESPVKSVRSFIGYFDGACQPVNPGGTMGFGAVITEHGNVIWKAAGISDDKPSSNNIAEYTALLTLLEFFISAGLTDARITICGDSKLVCEQMAGHWRIGAGLYVPTAKRAKRLLARFSNIRFRWIARQQNQLADELSKLELTRAAPLRLEVA
jgi:ribonuclease HI